MTSIASGLVLEGEAGVSEDVEEAEIVSSGDQLLILRNINTVDVGAVFAVRLAALNFPTLLA
jgi:hypothetical protein